MDIYEEEKILEKDMQSEQPTAKETQIQYWDIEKWQQGKDIKEIILKEKILTGWTKIKDITPHDQNYYITEIQIDGQTQECGNEILCIKIIDVHVKKKYIVKH